MTRTDLNAECKDLELIIDGLARRLAIRNVLELIESLHIPQTAASQEAM